MWFYCNIKSVKVHMKIFRAEACSSLSQSTKQPAVYMMNHIKCLQDILYGLRLLTKEDMVN